MLFELLVPPTTEQLELVEDERGTYDRQLRPELTAQAMAALQAAGVEPHIWKVEGLYDPSAARAIVSQARAGGREASCIVLGRGDDFDKVASWARVPACVNGFVGFAVGRTLWHDALAAHLAGRCSPHDAT